MTPRTPRIVLTAAPAGIDRNTRRSRELFVVNAVRAGVSPRDVQAMFDLRDLPEDVRERLIAIRKAGDLALYAMEVGLARQAVVAGPSTTGIEGWRGHRARSAGTDTDTAFP